LRALAVLAVLLAAGAAVVWGTSSGRRDQLLQRYEEAAVASQARTWPRAVDPPGWEVVPGAAAERYAEAWAAAQALTWTEPARVSLDRARVAMAPPAVRASYAARLPLFMPGLPVPETCVALGAPALTDDRVLAQLDPGLCELLAEARPAMELLALGSRSADTGSPLSIWADPTPGSGGSLQRLVKLLLLDGRLALARGDADTYIDAIATSLRVGVDLSRGAGMGGALAGMAVTDRASRDLEYLLAADVLTAAQARRVHDELAHVNARPMLVGEAVADELLKVSAPWFAGGDLPSPVPPSDDAWSLPERIVIGMACNELAWAWDELLEAQLRPYADRSRDYLRIGQQLADSDNPVASSWAALDFAGLDARTTAARTRLQLLQVAAADAVVRLDSGASATSVRQLAEAVPGLPTTGALSGAPFLLEHDHGERSLTSAALAEPARSRLGVTGIAPLIQPETYLRVTLVLDKSLQNQ